MHFLGFFPDLIDNWRNGTQGSIAYEDCSFFFWSNWKQVLHKAMAIRGETLLDFEFSQNLMLPDLSLRTSGVKAAWKDMMSKFHHFWESASSLTIKNLMCLPPIISMALNTSPFLRSYRNIVSPINEKRIECDCGNGSNPLFSMPLYKNLYKRRCSVIVYPIRSVINNTYKVFKDLRVDT